MTLSERPGGYDAIAADTSDLLPRLQGVRDYRASGSTGARKACLPGSMRGEGREVMVFTIDRCAPRRARQAAGTSPARAGAG